MLKEKELLRKYKSIRFSSGLLLSLKKLSGRTGLNFSELVRDALEQYVTKYENEPNLMYKTNKITLDEKRK